MTGSAFKNKRGSTTFRYCNDGLPSPLDIGDIKGTKLGSEDELR